MLSYPVGATVKDRSRHTIRGCTREGPNRAVGPDRVAPRTEPVARWRQVPFGRQVHRVRSAVSGEHGAIGHGAIRRTTRGDRSSGRPEPKRGLAYAGGTARNQLSCHGERTPYKELTLSQVPYEHGLLVDGSLLVCVFRSCEQVCRAVQCCVSPFY